MKYEFDRGKAISFRAGPARSVTKLAAEFRQLLSTCMAKIVTTLGRSAEVLRCEDTRRFARKPEAGRKARKALAQDQGVNI